MIRCAGWRSLLAATLMGAASLGCASLSQLDDFEIGDPGGSGGGGATTSGEGGGASGGGAAAGGQGGFGGYGGGGGVGGQVPICGNGTIDGDEECDDGNTSDGDSCDSGCVVDCGTTVKWGTHCYFIRTQGNSWTQAQQACQSTGVGWDLVAVSSQPERDWVDYDLDPDFDIWTGGNDLTTEGTFEWRNGEPWSYAPWASGEPNDNMGQDCVMLRADPNNPDRFGDRDCSVIYGSVCEMTPAGM